MDSIIPGMVNELPKFSAMYNMVHIDEKWFYMSDKIQRFYLFPWEDDPYRATQSKTFMAKVMFNSGVARPHITSDGEVIWDGKLGIFAFTEQVAAKKFKEQMSKWPLGACKEIWIQQDNARPHIHAGDTQFKEAATKDGFNIRLINQPAQSPDMNVLDLGFFRAFQLIQYKEFPKSVDELIKAVKDAYNIFNPKSLNYTWLHLQYCMLEILQLNGGNNYKNPHKGKRRLESMGLLPVQIEVPTVTRVQAQQFLSEGYVEVNITQEHNIEDNMSQIEYEV
ncbi:uncharacterized protein [Spinacia oleracea]|uniref:Transposase n=1 Tax=Spinacia oleracea TaxID=3562 RepID=A0A9R0JBX2_SPIOL|nr:uncharacterized protein LOC110803739 [Spinacia oleracea]